MLRKCPGGVGKTLVSPKREREHETRKRENAKKFPAKTLKRHAKRQNANAKRSKRLFKDTKGKTLRTKLVHALLRRTHQRQEKGSI